MNTYEIPDEPDGPLWGPTNDGEGWVEYWRSQANKLWYEPRDSRYGRLTWGELLMRGPLVDEDPSVTLKDLADQVLSAALTWHEAVVGGQQYADAVAELRRAIRAYRKKLEQR